MTLAELFLLILFVVWYSRGSGAGPNWKEIAKQRETQLKQKEDQIADLKRTLIRLEDANKWWQENFGVDIPRSQQELAKVLESKEGEAFRQDMARGFARCTTDNLILQASVVNGSIEVKLRSPVSSIAQSQEWPTPPMPGSTLSSRTELDRLMNGISIYYKQHSASPCRFDYSMSYATKEDYYDGRVLFEALLYPAGIKRVNAQ